MWCRMRHSRNGRLDATSRRDVLGRMAFGLSFLPALAFVPRALLWSLLFEPDAPLVAAKPLPPNEFTRDGKALVVMVHGRDMEAMVEHGVARLGGLGGLALFGKSVLVKPNVVNNQPPPSTTSPMLVAAVARMVKQAGGAVTVAESSGMLRFPTSDNLSETGIRSSAESAGA